MLVSYKHNFLFIHIPKAAGSSITNSLRPFAERPELLLENRLLRWIGVRQNLLGPYRRRMFVGHASAQQLRSHLAPGGFEELFKFAFVRNPWDRLVSQYSFVRQSRTHKWNRRVMQMDFPQFADFWTDNRRSQLHLLTDSQGELLVDYVGYFESIREDFDEICRRIGLTVELPHKNRSAHKDYRSFYDDRLAEMVAQRRADEIARFGYTFDGGFGQQPLRKAA